MRLLLRLALTASVLALSASALAQRPNLPVDAPATDAPWPTDDAKFTFAILGDKTGGGYENWPIFDRAVAEIERLRPDFVIMVGDLVQGYTDDPEQVEAQWDEFKSHIAPLTVPFLALPGNHDVAYRTGTKYWRENWGRTYYDFVYKGCHFVMMNTDERWEDDDLHFGQEQVDWAVAALESVSDARHTFVFMHKPVWSEDNPEWTPIRQALGDRPFTVFGGHWHDLKHEGEHGERYIVHSATGGGLDPSPVKELGAFHHYTVVTVEDDSVYFSVEEPGASWPVDIAPVWFADSARAIVRSTAIERRTEDDRAVVEIVSQLRNGLPGPARVVLRPVLDGANWAPSPDSAVVDLEAGQSDELRLTFTADADDRIPVPKVALRTEYRGTLLWDVEPSPVNPFPESADRAIIPWYVLGPFDAGEINTGVLPENPREGLPGMFVMHGPEKSWRLGGEYHDGDEIRRWQRADADTAGKLNFDEALGQRDFLVGYAATSIYSPEPRRTALKIRADNFMQVYLNGELVGANYGSPYDVDYVPLDLNRRWNLLVVKLVNNHGNWYFISHVVDEDGDLRISRPEP